jgi:hypothetical protein
LTTFLEIPPQILVVRTVAATSRKRCGLLRRGHTRGW